MDNISYNNIQVEWEGDAPHVFSDIGVPVPSEKGKRLEARILFSKQRAGFTSLLEGCVKSLQLIVEPSILKQPVGQAILALTIISVINPIEFKLMRGRGIDPIIESAKFDNDTGELHISKKKFMSICNENNIPSKILPWLENNDFVYVDEGRIVFRNSVSYGDIIIKS